MFVESKLKWKERLSFFLSVSVCVCIKLSLLAFELYPHNICMPKSSRWLQREWKVEKFYLINLLFFLFYLYVWRREAEIANKSLKNFIPHGIMIILSNSALSHEESRMGVKKKTFTLFASFGKQCVPTCKFWVYIHS